jgi:hypothetical protein
MLNILFPELHPLLVYTFIALFKLEAQVSLYRSPDINMSS